MNIPKSVRSTPIIAELLWMFHIYMSFRANVSHHNWQGKSSSHLLKLISLGEMSLSNTTWNPCLLIHLTNVVHRAAPKLILNGQRCILSKKTGFSAESVSPFLLRWDLFHTLFHGILFPTKQRLCSRKLPHPIEAPTFGWLLKESQH